MVLGFKERFVNPILLKTKLHTLRADSCNRWKAGMRIHMATGIRTSKYKQFHEEICTSTQQIEIIRVSDYLQETIIKVDGKQLTEEEMQRLAWNDGFDNLIDFWMWFRDGFKGKIIHWTETRY